MSDFERVALYFVIGFVIGEFINKIVGRIK